MLNNTATNEYIFTGGDYKWFCFPEHFTQPNIYSSFKDKATGLNVMMEAPIDVVITNFR